MQLGDLLTQDRIRVPLLAEDLAEAVERLLPLLRPDADERGREILNRLQRGERGSILSPSPSTVLLVLRGGEEGAGALGVAPSPLTTDTAAPTGGGGPRVVLLLQLPTSTGVGDESLRRLGAILATPEMEEALLAADTPVDVRSLRRLMGADLGARRKVGHAMKPLAYRVYPDSPVDEAVDLMARKGLSALPVVGERMEVLGVVTEDEALRHATERRRRGEGREGEHPLTVRNVMSRTVLCISEDAELLDAAQLMINKDVGHLPVLRDGGIVGMLDRGAVLRALTGE